MGREIINNLITSGKQGKPWFHRYVVLSGQLTAGLFLYNQMKKEALDFEVPRSIYEINAFFQSVSAHCGQSYAPAFALDAAELKVIPEDELARLVATLVTAHQQQLLNYRDLPQVFMDLLVGTKYHPVSIPDDLIEFMVGLADSRREDSVYCPFNSSFSLALAAAKKSSRIYIELEEVSILPIVCNILRGGTLKTVLGNPITNPSWTEPGHLKSFNVGLAFPPLDIRYQKDELNDLYGRFSVASHYGDLLHINHIIAQCQKAVIAIPQSFLQRTTGNERLGKKSLLEKKCIKAVIALPALFSQSSIPPMALLVIDKSSEHSSINFIDGTNEYFIKRQLGRNSQRGKAFQLRNIETLIEQASEAQSIKFARQIPCSDIEANQYNLQVSRYVLSNQQVKLQRVIDDTPSMPLSDIAHLIRAQALKSITPEGQQGLLLLEAMPADFNEAGEVESPGKMVTVDRGCERVRQQSLKPGDILLVVKGQVGKVGLVSSICGSNWVASQAFIIIRLKEGGPVKDPVVLFRYLCSPVGQALLDRIECTGKVPLLQTTDIQRLPVPVMTEEQQRQVQRTHQDIKKAYAEIRFLRDKAKGINSEVWSL